MVNNNALVILSGGQDSSTCLFWALQNFEKVSAISFDYGQRHLNELEAAKYIAKKAGVPFNLHKINTLASVSKNALTDTTIKVKENVNPGQPPNTLVEGRNLLFLTYAAIQAKQIKADNLIIGVSQTDYSGYPDCRYGFIKSANATLNLAMDHEFAVYTPLMWKNKAETWQMAAELGVFEIIKDYTVTCYHGMPGDGCGKCPACKLRNAGLEEFINTATETK